MINNKRGFESVLFFGRENCIYSNKIKEYLNQNSKTLIYLESKERNKKIDIRKIKNKKFDFIFCFRSYFILKKKLINQSKYGAINFHPGPPNFRGIGAVNFAIYKNSKFYGSTAHYMDHKIDNGKIIDVVKFKISNKDNIEKILEKTHQIMFSQAIRVIKNCLKNKKYYYSKFKKIKFRWSKKLYTTKDLEKLYEISVVKNKSNLDRIIKATYTKNFKPFLKIKNRKYFLINND